MAAIFPIIQQMISKVSTTMWYIWVGVLIIILYVAGTFPSIGGTATKTKDMADFIPFPQIVAMNPYAVPPFTNLTPDTHVTEVKKVSAREWNYHLPNGTIVRVFNEDHEPPEIWRN